MRQLLIGSLLFLSMSDPALAGPLSLSTKRQLVRLNENLAGSVVDFTNNHRQDNRFWSETLNAKREMYVYLPPGYDPAVPYPIMIWLHGFIQDERNFLELAPLFDRAIVNGTLPPMIIAAPDGSISGDPSIFHAGSFYLNSRAGRYEDYLICDVWNFLNAQFAIRPEAEAHVLAGASMGGFAAFNLSIKHRDTFKVVVGIMPPINWRYSDCKGRYMANFDPNCYQLADRYRPHSTIGCFYHFIHVQQRHTIAPLFRGTRKEIAECISRENPLEMLDLYDIKGGDLSMFIGYGTHDEFNIDAQVESFLFFAKPRGIEPKVVRVVNGRHNSATGVMMLPDLAGWLEPLIRPYAPAPKCR